MNIDKMLDILAKNNYTTVTRSKSSSKTYIVYVECKDKERGPHLQKVKDLLKGEHVMKGGSSIGSIESNGYLFLIKSLRASSNSQGRVLANAAELATVKSLTTEIKCVNDTGEKYFIDNPQDFDKWVNTFKLTKPAVESVIKGSLNNYDILHDATDKSDFSKCIKEFIKGRFSSSDAWNPADIYLVKKGKLKEITKTMSKILESDDNDYIISQFNSLIYELYTKDILYPISLKQIIDTKAKIEYSNIPGKIELPTYDISIKQFNLDLSYDTQEIGLFVFTNNITNKNINMQIRGFPFGYSTSQTEITSDGSKTGGRLGKVPTPIIDRTLMRYKKSRIKSLKEIGPSPKKGDRYLSKLDIDDLWDDYKTCKSKSYVKVITSLSTKKDLESLLSEAYFDPNKAASMCHKIQGLRMMRNFIDCEKDISNIIGSFIIGAKKLGNDNGFFIKIY